MGSNFEFSPLIMGLIILVTIIRIFTSKPKVNPMEGDATKHDHQTDGQNEQSWKSIEGQIEEHVEGAQVDKKTVRPPQTIEELLGQLIEKQTPKSQRRVEPVVQVESESSGKKNRVASQQETQRRAQTSFRSEKLSSGEISDDIKDEIGAKSDREIGDSGDGHELNFDLRQAVIMSEILTRKYDE
ncbi:MAG: hypothetical protein SNI51_05665 [Rikenellaceae bacterium]